MKTYTKVQVDNRTHLVCPTPIRGNSSNIPEANYMNTAMGLCGVLNEGESIEQWEQRCAQMKEERKMNERLRKQEEERMKAERIQNEILRKQEKERLKAERTQNEILQKQENERLKAEQKAEKERMKAEKNRLALEKLNSTKLTNNDYTRRKK